MMQKKGNNNDGSKGLGKHRFCHEKAYQCDMAEGLFSPENFCDTPVGTLFWQEQCHDNLMEHDYTTGCWATTTPKAELIVIEERINDIV